MSVVEQRRTLREAVGALAADISPRGLEIERAGTLPVDLVERFHAAGLFSLALPESLGGLECPPETIIEVVEEISRADGSAGWTLLIGQGSGFCAWLDPDVAKELLAESPAPAVASAMTPVGRGLVRDRGSSEAAYQVSGRWPFTSGCLHADLMMCAFVLHDGDGPRMGPGGRPVTRFAFFPAAASRVDRTWDVMGLQGTGSHDVVVEDVRVAHELTIDPFFEPAHHAGPLYQASFFSFLMVMMAGFPLGVARRALDELHALAHRKKRPGSGQPLAEDPLVQADVIRGEMALRAARSQVFDAVGDLTARVAAIGAAEPLVRARLAAAVRHAMDTAREVATVAFHGSGASALHEQVPVQRCFRDVHAAAQHVAFGQDALTRLGRAELGLPTPPFLL